MVPLVGAFFVDEGQHCTHPQPHATHLLNVSRNVCNAGPMTRDTDPLVVAANKVADLQKQVDDAQRELVRLIEHELERGVPSTPCKRRPRADRSHGSIRPAHRSGARWSS